MIESNFHRSNNTLQGRYNNMNLDYWTPNNPGGYYPRPNIGNEGAVDGGLMVYFDGSYVKLRNLTLGHNFDTEVASSLGLSRLRAYIQGQNLWFSSDYDTWDPEVGEERIDSGVAPSSSMWAVGIRANF